MTLDLLRQPLRLLAMLCTLGLGQSALADTQWEFDFANRPTFLGFGAHMWIGPPDVERADALLKDLNAHLVRISLTPKITFDQLRPGQSVEELVAILDRNDSPVQRERMTAFRDRMKRLGIDLHLIFWRMPDPWVSNQPGLKGATAQRHFARPEFIPDYANLIVAQLLYLRRLGIVPAAIELTNEPHGAWDTKFEPEDYAQLAQVARRTLDRQGFNQVAIEGPGTSLKEFDRFIGGLQRADAARALGLASVHVYETPEQLADPSTSGIASFAGRGHFGPVVATEFGVRMPEDITPAAALALVQTPDFALSGASSAVILLAQGARGLIYWQLQDPPWAPGRYGMLAVDGTRRPAAAAMQTLFGRAAVGARVAPPKGATPAGLYGVALQSDTATWLLVVNHSGAAQDIQTRFSQGSGACKTLSHVAAWQVRGQDAAGKPKLPADCTLKASVADGAVLAFELR